MILCHGCELGRHMLSPTSSCFEFFDFNSNTPETAGSSDGLVPPTRGVSLIQEYSHLFKIRKPGFLNTLSLFIWIDLGGKEKVHYTPLAHSHSSFPFGDKTLAKISSPVPPGEESEKENHITSFYSKHNPTYASNWMNPILILPTPRQVEPGDVVRAKTKVLLDSWKPSYHFTLVVIRGEEELPLGSITLDYQDLYPDFTPLV